jgi:purine-nucleoside phosphorylase
MTYLEQISQSVDYLVSKGILNPEVGLVLGTRFSKLIKSNRPDYAETPNFPVSVEFQGKLLLER